MDPLVSIITPCWNGENFLDDYFRSILAQTYVNIELIFINDGSTDSTEHIVQHYREKCKEKGIKFIYIYQKNQGQAVALNRGLLIFHGKYFVWPDSDDLLDPESIKKRVHFLEENPEYGFVRSNADYFDFDTKKRLFRASESLNRFHTDIFLDLILEKTYCCCGCYMVRRSIFLEVYPHRQILPSPAGQNWQLLIPISGRYQCGYIDEDLYHIAVREGSHSRQTCDYDTAIKRQKQLKEVLLSSVSLAKRDDMNYKEIIETKYLKVFFNISIQYHKYEEGKEYYEQLRSKNTISKEERKLYFVTFYPLPSKIISIFFRVYKMIREFFTESKYN